MLCQECGKRPATVHITRIVNGQQSDLDLCEECAHEYQQELGIKLWPSFSVPQFLASLLSPEVSWEEGSGTGRPSTQRQLKCHECGLTYEQFQKTGRLGCSKCYEYFGGQLRPLVRRIHGHTRHTGKVPARGAGTIKAKKDLERLRAVLAELIDKEEFEKAAQVRDQIRALEGRL